MKNVTVSLDDATYRRARLRAAEMDKSLSALVREYLATLGSGETREEQLRREEQALREQVRGFSAADRLTRDAVHERGR